MKTFETLDYSHSKHFFDPDKLNQLPANDLAFALRVAANECDKIAADGSQAKFRGVYVLQQVPQSPAIPVVYLIDVDSDTFARQVHQFVWNQNQTPFLIVESPTTIRLYRGFAFNRDKDESLLEIANDAGEILEKLAAFRAESIDDGTLWKRWAHAVDPSQRVDETLLRDLEMLDRRLQQQGMDRNASHGLIGRYVYLNYLRDRGILSDKKLARWEIKPEQLFSKQATLKAFHQVNDELQTWLNGSVFSLGEDAISEITVDQLKLVARVFAGDSPTGMSDIQLSLFDAYDFSHIPIETLSCVYEQFLHDAKGKDGTSRVRTLGAYYTPLPLADYVLAEIDRRRPLQAGMTVLDPACGSGAFLVQCYRRLIERQRRIEARELKATELRDLLTTHIFGIDRDDDACRVAELSLIMTLLDYIEPPDLEHTNFRLPSLRNQNIVQGDFFDKAGPAHDLLAERQFDWIVGNPPWAEVKGTPSSDHEHYVAHHWMLANKKTHPTSGNQLAEAFLWKSGEHLAKDGACGLVVLAMTWFKKEATTFRRRFFSERRVWCLANFANLAYVLFAGRSERPASVVFFENEKPTDDHVILTFAPFVAEQVANRPEKANKRLVTWNIVVAGSELREIDQTTAARGESLTWKLAMWGTSRDRKLLQRMGTRFDGESLDSLTKFAINEPHQGLELRTSVAAADEQLEYHPDLIGKKRLKIDELRGKDRLFSFPAFAIGRIASDECYVRKGRARLAIAVSNPPHIVVDASRRFAVFSNEFIAVPPRQIGISGSPESSDYLRAISLFLSSDFFRYHQFFNAPKWGVDESIADLHTLKTTPIPIGRLGPREIQEWAQLQSALAKSFSEDLVEKLNDLVFQLLGTRTTERWLVEDFVQLHLELNKGKFTPEVMRSPTADERQTYLLALRKCLDGFLPEPRGLRHKLEALVDHESALLATSLVRSKTAIEPNVIQADDPASRSLKTIRERLRSKHSQWVYFDRNLKVYDPKKGVLYQFKPLQRLHWTRRQAVLDADDIIAETLSEGETS